MSNKCGVAAKLTAGVTVGVAAAGLVGAAGKMAWDDLKPPVVLPIVEVLRQSGDATFDNLRRAPVQLTSIGDVDGTPFRETLTPRFLRFEGHVLSHEIHSEKQATPNRQSENLTHRFIVADSTGKEVTLVLPSEGLVYEMIRGYPRSAKRHGVGMDSQKMIGLLSGAVGTSSTVTIVTSNRDWPVRTSHTHSGLNTIYTGGGEGYRYEIHPLMVDR